MKKRLELIYCADGNPTMADIAIKAGFTYGARLPATIYRAPEFVDQDFKDPDRDGYMAALRKHKPRLATVLDWDNPGRLPEVLAWAEEAGPFVQTLIIVPKVRGGVCQIPPEVSGTPVRLGFSYPTGYAGADWSILYEMVGWPNGVHILGGPPHGVLALAEGRFKPPWRRKAEPDLFLAALDIRSADGNMILKMATKFCAFWDSEKRTRRGSWPSLKDYDGEEWDGNAPVEAFERSCRNFMRAWRGL
jgi:hypothetical protein